MQKPVHNNTGRILGAIVSGCVAAIAMFIVFLPVIYLVLDNFLVFNFGPSRDGGSTNIFIIIVAFTSWSFLTMYAGGYVTARMALQNEYHLAWTLVGIGALILFVYFPTSFLETGIILIVGIFGVLAGCHSGIRYKQKRQKIKKGSVV